MFDLQSFTSSTTSARESEISIAALAPFFSGEPVVKVRQLSGYELARCQEAVQRNRDVAGLVAGITSTESAAKIEAIRKALGVDEAVPDEIAKRIEMLILGGVEPVWDREAAVKLCAGWPVEFYTLTTEIIRLTGEGALVGELIGSGKAKSSEPPSPLQTNGADLSSN